LDTANGLPALMPTARAPCAGPIGGFYEIQRPIVKSLRTKKALRPGLDITRARSRRSNRARSHTAQDS
jgi:hypothetical protein